MGSDIKCKSGSKFSVMQINVIYVFRVLADFSFQNTLRSKSASLWYYGT